MNTAETARKALEILDRDGWCKGTLSWRRQIAERAERELSEHGWCKGSFEKSSGEICLSSAFRIAFSVYGSGAYSLSYENILRVIRGLFPGRDYSAMFAFSDPDTTLFLSVSAFNDHPDTTREDISLVLKHLGEMGE